MTLVAVWNSREDLQSQICRTRTLYEWLAGADRQSGHEKALKECKPPQRLTMQCLTKWKTVPAAYKRLYCCCQRLQVHTHADMSTRRLTSKIQPTVPFLTAYQNFMKSFQILVILPTNKWTQRVQVRRQIVLQLRSVITKYRCPGILTEYL